MVAQSPHHRIGDAARLSGVSAANIRYYEKEGLLAAQARSENAYRLYTDAEVHRLRFIRLCRAMDMSLDEVRRLLALDGSAEAGTDAAPGVAPQGHAAHTACATLDEHLAHVRTRLQELHTLEQELLALRGRCDGRGGDCQVIAALHAQADAQPLPAVAPERGAATKRHV